ncbi:uncharacterized protein SPAPADRAFT_62589 [Spathaspora passalidarum NRRL Y-27907]|uniref:[PSI+] induction protein 2 n=1 Tax=Spathaspora passalidarum (strain NRRL Y-27907 / 11-Y1) TaxID=619300 RepID=G3ASP5_SPAPN|nr:uncharacterized protein SPAPADRAFT_62589 [Spathaspora passalidarum NRRL Y-27907]EGW30731.1 hypothetical protein SPAPADRAFT_62589 [Spathaspora passalidarum NRRL Y-27907]
MYLLDIDKRDVFTNAKTTAQAFRSWDTCMANRTCKIVAIVLIVLGGLLVIWVVTTIFQCLFMGAKCIDACCCCCCRNSNKNAYVEKQSDYPNPNMYPPHTQQRYAYQPQPPPNNAYFPTDNYNSNDNNYGGSNYSSSNYNRGYEPVQTNAGRDSPFDDHNKSEYRGYH